MVRDDWHQLGHCSRSLEAQLARAPWQIYLLKYININVLLIRFSGHQLP